MIIAHLKQTQHPVQSCLEMNRKYTLLGPPEWFLLVGLCKSLTFYSTDKLGWVLLLTPGISPRSATDQQATVPAQRG